MNQGVEEGMVSVDGGEEWGQEDATSSGITLKVAKMSENAVLNMG